VQKPLTAGDLRWDATGHLDGSKNAVPSNSVSAAGPGAEPGGSMKWLRAGVPSTAAAAGATTAALARALPDGELSALTVAAAAEASPEGLASLWGRTPQWVGAATPGPGEAKSAVQGVRSYGAGDKCVPLATLHGGPLSVSICDGLSWIPHQRSSRHCFQWIGQASHLTNGRDTVKLSCSP
jgi:hypothetical protein